MSNIVNEWIVLFEPNETLTDTTTPSQGGPGSNSSEGVLRIPQSSRTEDSPLDGLVSYSRHTLGMGGMSCPSVEMQSAYYTAPADRANRLIDPLWCVYLYKY